VHLRRALLLFAIVLGLAALVASVSRPPEESGERADGRPPPSETPMLSPGSESPPGSTIDLVFDAGREQTRRVDSGQPATLLVEAEEPGMVEIPDLGLSAAADPLTPARFEVLVSDPGRYALFFTPAGGEVPDPAGTLVVREEGGE
jgi:hypothetical protein